MAYGESEGDLDGPAKLLRVPHVSIDIGEDGVSSPWGHEQAERDGEREPV
jgi:hypothetical protein